jgi:hypothetical protein
MVAKNQRSTYFYLVARLVPYGHQSGLGLTSRRSTLKTYQITLFSLPIHQVVDEGGCISCNSFGSYVFELCGMREIKDYLETQNNLLLRCWTRSNSIPIIA